MGWPAARGGTELSIVADVRASGIRTDGLGNAGYHVFRYTRGSRNGGWLTMEGRMERREGKEGMMDPVATVRSIHHLSTPSAFAPSIARTFTPRSINVPRPLIAPRYFLIIPLTFR